MLFGNLVATAQNIQPMKIAELESYIASRTNPAVINFWATWCAPCVEEMSWFNKILNENKNKNVELVFVSLDHHRAYPQQIEQFIKRRKLKATFIWLDETNADVFCPRIDESWSGTIPATLFVNTNSGYRKFIEEQISPFKLKKEVQSLKR
jgi:thiol-disulfide isomerase/thioredoxin